MKAKMNYIRHEYSKPKFIVSSITIKRECLTGAHPANALSKDKGEYQHFSHFIVNKHYKHKLSTTFRNTEFIKLLSVFA